MSEFVHGNENLTRSEIISRELTSLERFFDTSRDMPLIDYESRLHKLVSHVDTDPLIATVPNLKLVLHGVIFGGVRSPKFAKEFFEARLQPKIREITTSDSVFDTVNNTAEAHIKGLEELSLDPTAHKQRINNVLKSAVSEVSREEIDPQSRHDLYLLIRAIQYGGGPNEQRPKILRNIIEEL